MTNNSHIPYIPCYPVRHFDYCPGTPVFSEKVFTSNVSRLSSFFDLNGHRPDKIVIVGKMYTVPFGYYSTTFQKDEEEIFEYQAHHDGIKYLARIWVDG